MNWNELRKSVYQVDGSWRDIYVLNATRDDWKKWIEHVNDTYEVTFTAEGYKDGVVSNKVDAGFIDYRWDEEHYTACASVFLRQVQINCHFFTDEQIENDIDPKEVESIDDHLRIVDYMKSISKLLGKEVILTEENSEEAIWIKVNQDTVLFL
ncbi:MAG: hypothetical protein ACRYG7_53435 [Janthinobacterium lividum]